VHRENRRWGQERDGKARGLWPGATHDIVWDKDDQRGYQGPGYREDTHSLQNYSF
jgi:hypothetical protein